MYDVVVIGGGSMGIAAAYYRAKTGANVLVLDKYEIPNQMSSHHGMTRMLRLNYGDGSNYVPLAQEALKLWREIETDSKKDLFRETGCITVGPKYSNFVNVAIESALLNNNPYRVMNAEELMKEWPGVNLPAHYIGCYDPKAGYLFSEACLAAYKEKAQLFGADIHENEGVHSIKTTSGGYVCIETLKGTYYAEKAIVTAGPWLNKLLPDLDLKLQPVRKTISWFKPKENSLYTEGHFPCFVFDTKTDGHYYGFPDFKNYGVKLGRMDNDIPCDPDELDRKYGSYAQDERDVRSFLSHYLPQAEGQLLDGKVCMFTRTPDDNFIIDVHPNHPNIILAGGFSGHGFKFASVIGSILSEMSIDGRTTRDISFLKLDRFTDSTMYKE